MYDIQVSSDAKTWTTVHRNLRGYANMIDDVTMYQKNVRYVRILGYTKVESGSGVGINELSVYEYREGDSKENETIAPLPTRQVINNKNGKGSYVSGEMYKEKNKLPTFVNEETIKTPIDSNSWWSSAMVQTFRDLEFCLQQQDGLEQERKLTLEQTSLLKQELTSMYYLKNTTLKRVMTE